jgi:putative ABC transport system ATP-binding protein
MATLFAEPATIAEPAIAAHTIDATKVYGRGQTEMRTLDGITVAFTAKRFTAITGPSDRGTQRCCTPSPSSTR